jgi:hypothetical protein
MEFITLQRARFHEDWHDSLHSMVGSFLNFVRTVLDRLTRDRPLELSSLLVYCTELQVEARTGVRSVCSQIKNTLLVYHRCIGSNMCAGSAGRFGDGQMDIGHDQI